MEALSHRAADKLYNLLIVACPWEKDFQTTEILEEIGKHCDMCQRFQSGLIRFTALLPNENELVFAGEMPLYLIFIDGKSILHIIETATHFPPQLFSMLKVKNAASQSMT